MQRGQLVGRDDEVLLAERFLTVGGEHRGLVLEGPPGMGKTSIWQAALSSAREAGVRILAAQAAEGEARLSLGGVADLLHGIDLAGVSLPEPQRDALERALLVSHGSGPAGGRAVAAGFLAVVRALACEARVCIALDDEQWVDAATMDAVAFAARRLPDDEVIFLLTRRSGGESPLEHAIGHAAVQRLSLGPLSLGAVRRLIHERLDLTLGRRAMRRLYETSGGNPMFALELARVQQQAGADDVLALPSTIEPLLRERLAGTTAGARRALLVASLAVSATRADVESVAGRDGLDEALDAEILVLDDIRVRPSHPLLAEAARGDAASSERRALYRKLADLATDDAERARRLALAATGPDPSTADIVAAAVAQATARADAPGAVVLAEHAFRLTPRSDPAWAHRLLDLGEAYDAAGDMPRMTSLAREAVGALPAGPLRARAYLLLADGDAAPPQDIDRYLESALEESRGDPLVRARALGLKSICVAVGYVDRVADAEAWATEAVDLTAGAGYAGRVALGALAWPRILRGLAVDDLTTRATDLPDALVPGYRGVERAAVARLIWRGDFDAARQSLRTYQHQAEERGEDESYFAGRLHLCELHLRIGDWDAAAELLDEWSAERQEEPGGEPALTRCQALLAAGRGDADSAEFWGNLSIAAAQESGMQWHRLEALRAVGLAHLLRDDSAQAAQCFQEVWTHTAAAGVRDPGAFPVGPDLVEALATSGATAAAQDITQVLASWAREQDHAWAFAAATRSEGVVLAATGGRGGVPALERAAETYDSLGCSFERARSLLLLGAARRRLQQRHDGRLAVEEAAAVFDQLGSPGWAMRARAELARFGGRRTATGELTPTEQRVAELAMAGRRNREIASELVVSVAAVEATLTRIYSKLGIRSRTELGHWLAARSGRTG